MKRNQIVARDLALAALVGAVPADFGHEGDDDGEFGAEFAYDAEYLDDVADVLDEEGFGAEFGANFADLARAAGAAQAVQAGAILTPQQAAQMHAMLPHAAAAQQSMRRFHAERNVTASRERLLEPNKGSRTKVERYTFSVSDDVVCGTPKTISVSNQPDTTIRPQRVTCNAPTPGFFIIDSIRVANVNVTVGGVVDAFDFNANGVGQSLDMPTLSPSNKLSVSGGYTGLIPSFLLITNPYKIIVSVKGPASIVA